MTGEGPARPAADDDDVVIGVVCHHTPPVAVAPTPMASASSGSSPSRSTSSPRSRSVAAGLAEVVAGPGHERVDAVQPLDMSNAWTPSQAATSFPAMQLDAFDLGDGGPAVIVAIVPLSR